MQGQPWFGVIAMVAALGWANVAAAEQEVPMQQQLTQLEADYQTMRQRIGSLDDPELANALGSLVFEWYVHAVEHAGLDAAPYEIEYTTPYFSRIHDYPDLAAMLNVYRDNLLALASSADMQCFGVREPFALPLEHRLEMQHITMADGTQLQMPDVMAGRRQTEALRARNDGFCFHQPLPDAAKPPQSVTAKLSARLPEQLLTFEFNRDDVGSTHTQHGYALTLEAMGAHSYQVRVEKVGNGSTAGQNYALVGEAQALNQRWLRQRTALTYAEDLSARKAAWLDELISQASTEALAAGDVAANRAEFEAAIKEGSQNEATHAVAFHGPVEHGKVTLMVYATEGGEYGESVSQTLDIPFHGSLTQTTAFVSVDALPTIDVKGPVFNQRPEVLADATDLDAAEMANEVEIRRRQLSPQSDPAIRHPEQLFLHYPKVKSDVFIGIFERFSAQGMVNTIKFFDASGEVIQPTSDISDAARFNVSRLEFDPEQLAQPPARLQGTVTVRTAPKMQQQAYAHDALPAGVVISDNRIVIDYAVFEPEEIQDVSARRVDRRNQVFAKDSDRRYLAEIGLLTQTRQDGDPVDIYYFYGEPQWFEIWYQGELEAVEFEINAEL